MTIETEIENFSGFKDWVDNLTSVGNEMLYRGLSKEDHSWNSSIARRIEKTNQRKPNFSDILKVTYALIEGVKKQGYHRDPTRRGETPATDFEILALLQHHHAATPLMDFSHNPLVALWFACRSHDKDDGRIIAVDPNNLEKISDEINIKTDSITRENVERISENGEKKPLATENNLWRFTPPGFDARILAQNSEFIFGKTELESGDIPATCVIPQSAKGDIQWKLNLYGISQEQLFQDFPGYAKLNSEEILINNLEQILDDNKSEEQRKDTPFTKFIRNLIAPSSDDSK